MPDARLSNCTYNYTTLSQFCQGYAVHLRQSRKGNLNTVKGTKYPNPAAKSQPQSSPHAVRCSITLFIHNKVCVTLLAEGDIQKNRVHLPLQPAESSVPAAQ